MEGIPLAVKEEKVDVDVATLTDEQYDVNHAENKMTIKLEYDLDVAENKEDYLVGVNIVAVKQEYDPGITVDQTVKPEYNSYVAKKTVNVKIENDPDDCDNALYHTNVSGNSTQQLDIAQNKLTVKEEEVDLARQADEEYDLNDAEDKATCKLEYDADLAEKIVSLKKEYDPDDCDNALYHTHVSGGSTQKQDSPHLVATHGSILLKNIRTSGKFKNVNVLPLSTKNKSKKSTSQNKGRDRYRCKVCAKQCSTLLLLREHELVSDKPLICNRCTMTFKTKHGFRRHVHLGEKQPHPCTRCDKVYYKKIRLNEHMLSHSGERPYACKLCSKTYSSKSGLRAHEVIHTVEKPFSCNLCPKTYAWSSSLKYHQGTHMDDKPFTCNLCAKAFLNKAGLREHEVMHTGERPYTCKLCPRTFSWRTSLKFHKLTHVTERPFACKLCHKSFVSNCTYKSHLKTHTDRPNKCKPNKCNLCPMTFKLKNSLQIHELLHLGEKPFTCNVCIKFFPTESLLRDHETVHLFE